MDSKEEVRNILTLTGNNYLQALDLLERQLNVLHTRAQVLMSLAGIVLTITGFSGRLIAGTSQSAQILVILGLATVLSSAVWVFLQVMQVKWLTGEVVLNDPRSLEKVILRRTKKTRAYTSGGFVLCIGLFLYCIAFALMLMNQQ
ncbi:MAG: hypothetical protein ACOY90_13060 [Candidatus Zhuqueibacterota bacterium]